MSGADFAKGSRFLAGGGSDDITFVRSMGNLVLSGMVNGLFRTRYTDLCYGYNAIWARHVPALRLDCDGFEVEAVMNIRAFKADLLIHEVPSHERPRVYGESNLNVIRDGWRIMKVIIRERMQQPKRRQLQQVTTSVAEASAPSFVAGGIPEGQMDHG
jgi:hypothetical protein